MTFQQHLLATTDVDVPVRLRESLSDFCATCPEVENGYVCRVERRMAGNAPETTLRFAVKLTTPKHARSDDVTASRTLMQRFVRARRELAETLGLTVLTDHGVPAWEAHAVEVFTRAAG
jgi:hypothetical protein